VKFLLKIKNYFQIFFSEFGKFQYVLILISGTFMGSAFFETMGINYVLPVAECDLNITSKSQYGLISGVWFAGEN
jgi:hypothetical protein